jgi:hypothetical protein
VPVPGDAARRGGNLPATLSLTTGQGSATFAPFVPGAEKDDIASLVANAISMWAA